MFLQVICKNGITRLLNLSMIQCISYIENQNHLIFTLSSTHSKEVTVSYATPEHATLVYKKIIGHIEKKEAFIMH